LSLSETEARALAKQLNWEPPDHDDYPGSIPESAWDHWRAFEFLAAQTIAWQKVDPAAWREARGTDWSPAFEAESDGRRLLIIQHDWRGFPDPPEWALHVVEDERGQATCLGCFDYWPQAWSGQGGNGA
jgi:hypothetical protein